MDFDKLYKDNYRQVHRTACRIVKDEEDAHDVAQETFIKVYQSLDSFRNDSSISTWLTEITVNTAKDMLRKKKNQDKVLSTDNHSENYEPTQVDYLSPERIISGHQDLKDLDTVVQGLSEKRKTAVVLRFLEEKSYKDIADMTGTPVNTVKTDVRRAKAELKSKVGPY